MPLSLLARHEDLGLCFLRARCKLHAGMAKYLGPSLDNSTRLATCTPSRSAPPLPRLPPKLSALPELRCAAALASHLKSLT